MYIQARGSTHALSHRHGQKECCWGREGGREGGTGGKGGRDLNEPGSEGGVDHEVDAEQLEEAPPSDEFALSRIYVCVCVFVCVCVCVCVRARARVCVDEWIAKKKMNVFFDSEDTVIGLFRRYHRPL